MGAMRVRWRELAERHGLVFHEELTAYSFARRFRNRSWPRMLIGPTEGSLDDESLEAVLRVLAGQTHGSVYFKFFPFPEDRPIYRGDLSEFATLFDIVRADTTPEYWWPEDQSWCLCTDYDLTFTLIAGSEALIAELVADDTIESVRVSASTRIDDLSDRRNATATA